MRTDRIIRLLDDLANKTRGRVPTPVSILDILLMDELERQREIRSITDIATDPIGTASKAVRKVRRKKSKYSKELSKQLKLANKAARTKSGKLRKGMTQGKILKKAHKMAKRRFK